jgi:hypothetical protein
LREPLFSSILLLYLREIQLEGRDAARVHKDLLERRHIGGEEEPNEGRVQDHLERLGEAHVRGYSPSPIVWSFSMFVEPGMVLVEPPVRMTSSPFLMSPDFWAAFTASS